MSYNYFRGHELSPYHISVAAVVINDDHEILVHYYEEVRGFENIYLLMRETLEPNETIEVALSRGLREEFGKTADLIDYLGSIKSTFPVEQHTIEKTTLYFLMKYSGEDAAGRLTGDPESESEMLWKPMPELFDLMTEQGKRFERTDLNESEIVARVQRYLAAQIS